VELARTGGRLSLHKVDAAEDKAEVPCGDVARTRGSPGASSTGMALIRPALQVDADPLLRELHAVVTSAAADAVPPRWHAARGDAR
jgi:hypothetical protein